MSSPTPTAARSSVRTFVLILLALCLCAGTVSAEPKAIGLLLEGRGDDYWICLVTHDAQQKVTLSSLRQRVDPVTGRWGEVARLQAGVHALAAVGNRVALLTEQGEIRMFWPGSDWLMPALPGNRRAVQIAGEADMLWAIGAPPDPLTTQPTTTRATVPPATARSQLFRWTGSSWAIEATLPPDVPADVSLAVYGGAPHIAYLSNQQVTVQRLEQSEWHVFRRLKSATGPRLISHAPVPLCVVVGTEGQKLVTDLSTDPPTVVQQFKHGGPWDVGVVTGNLRAIYIDDGKIQQVGYFDLGRGEAFGPQPVGQVISIDAAQQRAQWMQLAVVGLMTIAMVLTLRSSPPVPLEVLEQSGVHLAPLSRRLWAGLVDALPLLAAMLYVYRSLGVEAEPFVVSASLLPEILGLSVYLMHVTIAEMLWGRTIGKMIFGLRVVMNDGTPLTPGRAFLRNIMRILDISLMIPLVFVLISPLRQRIGDLAAGTLVVMPGSNDTPAEG